MSLGEGQYALSNDTKCYLVYSDKRADSTELKLPANRLYEYTWVDQASGQFQQPFRPVSRDSIKLRPEATVAFVRAID
ncbi:MAG: hypothetical protein R3C28_18035 [Pirellulaceae bacterium]